MYESPAAGLIFFLFLFRKEAVWVSLLRDDCFDRVKKARRTFLLYTIMYGVQKCSFAVHCQFAKARPERSDRVTSM